MKKALILTLILVLCASTLFAGSTAGFTFTDDLGRTFTFDGPIERIAPSGSLAQMILYSIACDKLVGLSSALSSDAMEYLNPSLNDLPLFGTFYGKKANLNREAVILASPDVVIDMGEIKGDEKSITEDLDALTRQIGIPVIFIECYLENTADAYRKLGELLGMEEEAEERAAFASRALDTADELRPKIGKKVRVYYSSNPDPLIAIASGSFHGEVLDKVGCENVVPKTFSDGGNMISLEQVLIWDPDVILLSDRNAYKEVTSAPAWKVLSAVENGRVYLIPTLPYSFIDTPPSVNRIIGIYWLGSLLYPELYGEIDLKKEIKDFYSLFYDYDLNDKELETLLNVQP